MRILRNAVAAAVLVTFAAAPAAAQLGQLGNIAKGVKKGADVLRDLQITDDDELRIGEAVSQRIRDRYGVVQDPAVHRYVNLVGLVLAQASTRPNVHFQFIVLDTDGVNAFAAPGGYIHITRGALALLANESELACVLGHEIIHVTEKHTLKAIQKGKLFQMGANEAGQTLGNNAALFARVTDKVTDMVLAGFGRDEELQSDQLGIRLANQVGYAPTGLSVFLTRLSDRNKSASGKQGLFASHPEMQERLDRINKQVVTEKLASTATLADRYRKFISYQPTAQTAIAGVEGGAAGLTGSSAKTDDKAKSDEDKNKKKKGFGLGSLLKPGDSEKKSAEVTGSAASRGVDTERNAQGGPVKTLVPVNITAADLAAFKKEGNLK